MGKLKHKKRYNPQSILMYIVQEQTYPQINVIHITLYASVNLKSMLL